MTKAKLAPEEVKFLNAVKLIQKSSKGGRSSRSKTIQITAKASLNKSTKKTTVTRKTLDDPAKKTSNSVKVEKIKQLAVGTKITTKKNTKIETSTSKRVIRSDDDTISSSTPSSSPAPVEPAQLKPKKVWLNAGLASTPRYIKSNHRRAQFKFSLPPNEDTYKRQKDFQLPWNIYCPNNGNRQVLRWKSLKKNIWRSKDTKQQRARLFKQSRDDEKCDCQGDNCGEFCFNRMFQTECNAENCNIGSRKDCGNRNFTKLTTRMNEGNLYTQGVEVVKAGDKGYGLTSIRHYPAHSLILEYTGEIIDQEEVERRLENGDYEGGSHFYFLSLGHGLSIDGAKRGSIARFANHSCEPNAEIQKWFVNGEPRVGLFAGPKGIQAGEEITYHYNFEWFANAKPQPCYCGAATCSGFIGKKLSSKSSSSSSQSPDTSRGTTPPFESHVQTLKRQQRRQQDRQASSSIHANYNSHAKNGGTDHMNNNNGNGHNNKNRSMTPSEEVNPYARPSSTEVAARSHRSRRRGPDEAGSLVDIVSMPLHLQKQLSINMAPPGTGELDEESALVVQLAANAAIAAKEDQADRKRTRHAELTIGREVGIPAKYLKLSNTLENSGSSRRLVQVSAPNSDSAIKKKATVVIKGGNKKAPKSVETRRISQKEAKALSPAQLALLKQLAIDDKVPVILGKRNRNNTPKFSVKVVEYKAKQTSPIVKEESTRNTRLKSTRYPGSKVIEQTTETQSTKIVDDIEEDDNVDIVSTSFSSTESNSISDDRGVAVQVETAATSPHSEVLKKEASGLELELQSQRGTTQVSRQPSLSLDQLPYYRVAGHGHDAWTIPVTQGYVQDQVSAVQVPPPGAMAYFPNWPQSGGSVAGYRIIPYPMYLIPPGMRLAPDFSGTNSPIGTPVSTSGSSHVTGDNSISVTSATQAACSLNYPKYYYRDNMILNTPPPSHSTTR